MLKKLNIILLTLLSLILVLSLSIQAEEEIATQSPSAKALEITEFNEAPMLKELVDKGELEPVEERLPADPVVVKSVDEIGEYGGTWNRVHESEGMGAWKMINDVEPFVLWERDGIGYLPNIVKEWEWNDKMTEITLHFVEGIKWSDGEPLDVNDFLFWWEDMVLDDRFPYTPPAATHIAGETMEVTKVDDYTLKFTFVKPNTLFFTHVNRGFWSSPAWITPSHYLKQFHPKYNSELTNEDVQELQDHYDNSHQYPDFPTFKPWKTLSYEEGGKVVFERNPYYWKVDTEGNQLPYIDRVESKRIQDSEMLTLRTVEGKLDAQFRNYDLRDASLLYQKQAEGDFKVMQWELGDVARPLWFMFGFSNPDEKIRDLAYSKNFRRALSYAINRKKIDDLFYSGTGDIRQAIPNKRAKVFNSAEGQEVYEAVAKNYTEYDPEKAKKLLDEIGMVDTNDDGYRERPDGEEFVLIVPVYPITYALDAMEFVKKDWESIGIKTAINNLSGAAWSEKGLSGDYTIFGWHGGSTWNPYNGIVMWTPVQYSTNCLDPQAGQYYATKGERGVAPKEGSALEKLQGLYSEMITATDTDERDKYLLEIYKVHAEEGPLTIGFAADHPKLVTIKNNFKNVPEFGILGPWYMGYPGTNNPEQFYIQE